MKKHLVPKADLTFKKIFGEHEDLLVCVLNALLPLKDDERAIVPTPVLGKARHAEHALGQKKKTIFLCTASHTNYTHGKRRPFLQCLSASERYHHRLFCRALANRSHQERSTQTECSSTKRLQKQKLSATGMEPPNFAIEVKTSTLYHILSL